MNAQEMKQAIADGEKVYWSNNSYEVIKDKIGQYLINYNNGQHCIGLTWQDGTTLNGEPQDFYIAATNFDIRITKDEAEKIVSNGLNEIHGFDVMCKEYEEGCNEWVGLDREDVDEHGKLPEELKTFEIFLPLLPTQSKRKEIHKFRHFLNTTVKELTPYYAENK